MESLTFARTKIQPPRFRAGLIERSELERRLGEALLRHRLVLLVAPAGYGKTAALARQLSLLPEGCIHAWVKADEEDDLPRLIVCMAHALEAHDPPWRVAPEALAAQVTQEHGLRTVAAELLDTLAAMPVTHGVLALDDVHFVGDPRVFEFLGIVLERLPYNWTLALATRAAPPLALSRLRARGELAEFRQHDLGFSEEEVHRLCVLLHPTAGGVLSRDLHERTGGWAAGVSLSLEAMEVGGPGHALHARLGRRHLHDFLSTEVLDRMPPELREFLLRCAVLAELTPERCAAVTGNARAAALLDEIERRGLFVSVLDSEVHTLRLHDLFRDFLEEKLRRSHAHELPILLRRAADSENDALRRLNLLLRAGARHEAQQLLVGAAVSLLTTSDSAQVMRLVEQFPQGSQESAPEVAYVKGLCAWDQIADRAVVARMQEAVPGFEAVGRLQKANEARAFQSLSLFLTGQAAEATRVAALARVPPMSMETAVLLELFDYWNSSVGGPMLAPGRHVENMLALLGEQPPPGLMHRCIPRFHAMLGREGVNAPMRRFADLALAVAGETNDALRAAVRVLDAWLRLWRADGAGLAAAIDALREEVRWLGQPRGLRTPLMRLQAASAALHGERSGVRAVWRAFLAEPFSPSMQPDWRADFTVQLGRLSAAIGDWPVVRRAVAALDGPIGYTTFPPFQPLIQVLRARYALHLGRHAEAAAMLRETLKISLREDRTGLDISVRTFLAVAELHLGATSAAWQVLAPLVERIRASAEVGGVLLFAGRAVLEELAEANWGAVVPAADVATLREWRDLLRRWHGGAAAAAGRPRVALSSRELEVLERVAAGDSNKLIARKLNLSPHTVKRHVARILDRLELSSRTAAAAWYAKRV